MTPFRSTWFSVYWLLVQICCAVVVVSWSLLGESLNCKIDKICAKIAMGCSLFTFECPLKEMAYNVVYVPQF